MPTNVDKYFTYAHLPEPLQSISKPIAELAQLMDSTLPDGAEKSAGMRKLLEAKDCFVRAALPENEEKISQPKSSQITYVQTKPNSNSSWTDLRKFEKLGE